MNKRTDNERLLEDVLAAETEGGKREASLENVLRLARRRRTRAARRVVSSVAVVVVSVIAFVRFNHPTQMKPEVAQAASSVTNLIWVTSQPLPVGAIVASRALLPEQIVTTIEMPNIVHTMPGDYREVDDDELIALTAPQVVALVRRGPHEMELIFVTEQPRHAEN